MELARTSGLTPREVARDLGADRDTLVRWLRQSDVDVGRQAGATSDEKAELARLRREVALLKEEREILRQAAASCARESATRCTATGSSPTRPPHAVRLRCRVMGVSRSGYYAWRGRQPSPWARADGRLAERIRRVHERSRGTYSRPRLHAELRADRQRCSRRRSARLMRQADLRGVHGRHRRVRTAVVDRPATPAPNRPGRVFAPAQIGAPDRLWLTDLSSVPTDEGGLSLAVVPDGFSRKVVGRAIADHLHTALALDALTMAIQARRPAAGEAATH